MISFSAVVKAIMIGRSGNKSIRVIIKNKDFLCIRIRAGIRRDDAVDNRGVRSEHPIARAVLLRGQKVVHNFSFFARVTPEIGDRLLPHVTFKADFDCGDRTRRQHLLEVLNNVDSKPRSDFNTCHPDNRAGKERLSIDQLTVPVLGRNRVSHLNSGNTRCTPGFTCPLFQRGRGRQTHSAGDSSQCFVDTALDIQKLSLGLGRLAEKVSCGLQPPFNC